MAWTGSRSGGSTASASCQRRPRTTRTIKAVSDEKKGGHSHVKEDTDEAEVGDLQGGEEVSLRFRTSGTGWGPGGLPVRPSSPRARVLSIRIRAS